ncbi:MAG: NAD(P)H-dependent oxidoreductase [Candidatus Paceibacterota bacterium]
MNENKKILLICGHPNADSLTGDMISYYQLAAEEVGYDVQRVNLGELNFDPVLRKGYKEIQSLEPDLVSLQEKILWADHLVIVYPNWWCSMPALLKGMFDRIWLPDFAFSFVDEKKKREKKLEGRTARVIILSGFETPFKTWWKYGDFTNEIQYGILDFAGIKTSVTAMGPCEQVDEKRREKWEREVAELGKKGI